MSEDGLQDGKRTLNVIDGALTQVSLALVCLAPTLGAVLFRPALLRPQIRDVQDQGRSGLLLAPGPFFVIGLFCGLVAVSLLSPASEGALITMGEDVRRAAGEGQFWRAASIGLPIFLASLALGLAFYVSARLWRLAERSLQGCLRGAQYGLFGFIAIVVVAEPLSNLVGPGGDNYVYEPVVWAATGLWATAFHIALMGGSGDRLWARLGAGVTVGACAAGLCALPYLV
ncbi:MAG: hypothetical protein RIA71_12280 [Oceanicaulis sp.]